MTSPPPQITSPRPTPDAFLALTARRRTVMGILNVTPDSFSDGGRFDTPDTAIEQANRLASDGADIIDIGAESTRPGHQPISADEEWRRLADVLPSIAAAATVPISIDTMKAEVAVRALAAGACVINDVWGLQRDPAMADVVAAAGAAIVVMHNREKRDADIDIVDDMQRFFERSFSIAARAGVPAARIVLDPGIGFGKTKAQNVAALAAVPVLRRFGSPVLIGVSRKSLFGALLGADGDERLVPTIAANLATATLGARIFRVHDVREHRMAFAVFDALGI